MTQEKRKFTGFIRVQADTSSVKLDLSPAEIYGGAEGLFRVRIHRRWVSLPDGTPFFCDKARLAEIIASLVFDGDFAVPEEPEPDIPMGPESRSNIGTRTTGPIMKAALSQHHLSGHMTGIFISA